MRQRDCRPETKLLLGITAVVAFTVVATAYQSGDLQKLWNTVYPQQTEKDHPNAPADPSFFDSLVDKFSERLNRE